MKRALVAGLVGLVAGGGLLVPQLAHAAPYGYSQTSCQGAALVTGTSGETVHGPAGADQIVCANGFAVDTAGAFDGGAVSAQFTGVQTGTTRLCPVGVANTTVGPGANVYNLPGIYVVADGDSTNAGGGQGYVGVSDVETGANETCPYGPGSTPPYVSGGPNNGSGTNSGGSAGIDNVVYVPVPLVVCGNTSGGNFGATGRDGCYNP